MPSVSLFGAAPRVTNIVLREQFTGDGSDTTFQLTSSPGNCTFNKGAWTASHIQTAYPAHVTGTDKKPTYDSAVILLRNRIGVSSIDASGLVTLDHAPRAGVDFYVWYWYQLQPIDEIDTYREDFVASMEAEAAVYGDQIALDTTNFDGILSATDTTLQVAMETIDDHLHDGQTLQCDGVNSDGGAFSFTTSGAVTFSNTVILSTCANAGEDTDKFLVLDGSGNIDYRTGAEVLSDIGGGAGGGNAVYVEEGDAARADSSAADLYIDFDDGDFDVGVVGRECNVTINDGGHVHDGATLQCDGITSDGGGFSFTTSGAVTFSNTVILSTCANAGVDTDKFLVLDAACNVDYRTGAEVLSDIGASASSHLHNGDTLQLDGINSDGGAFSFTTSGAVTFSNTVALTTCVDAEADVDKFLVLDAGNNVDYRTGVEVLSDIGAAAVSHDHDGDTLQLDGVNSDGGAFSFTTSGTLTFSNTVALTTCVDAAADTDKFLVLDGSNNIDYRTGVEVLSDIGASASSHLHDGATLQHDGVNSDGGAFSFTTSGTVTFSNTVNLTTCVDAEADTDKFLVLDGSGNVDYRTGAEVLSDIGAYADAKLDDGTAAGQMAFWDASKWTYTETSELFWDDTSKRVVIGTNTSGSALYVNRSVSGPVSILVNNPNSGASANTGVGVSNDAGDSTYLRIYGSSFAGGGLAGYSAYFGTGSLLVVAGASGSSGTNGEVAFLTGGYTVSTQERMRIDKDGKIGIGIASPAAKLHIDQVSASGAMPVLTLDQGDVSEEFLRLIGQSTTDASQSLVDAVDLSTPGSIVGWFKIYVQDDQATNPITDGIYYVPFYSAPT